MRLRRSEHLQRDEQHSGCAQWSGERVTPLGRADQANGRDCVQIRRQPAEHEKHPRSRAGSPDPGAGSVTGVEIKSGPWSQEAIERFLEASAIPVRLAAAGPDGPPLVQSLWFRYADDALWCATQGDSLAARRLAREPRCGFEVAGDRPPYAGVRGTGRAELLAEPAERVLRRLLDRYLGGSDSALALWLLTRVDDEVTVRIGDLSVTTWDFERRMRA